MSVQAPSRLTPIGKVTPFRAQRIWEKNYIAYRRLWKVIFSGFFEPVFYLFAVGVGVGALVGHKSCSRRALGLRCNLRRKNAYPDYARVQPP